MNIFFDSVGCRLNQAEIEHLANRFKKAGYLIVEKAENADMVVI
ncbi:tRNA (N(6)-L-threonylcarbamoyladenosine(37)-C(2))-methylthiotransferase MtaB, partial [bacterium]|nr:tRNA (N(6)-L-threonylcarbamoyladenosine(37)-C(2))-methylthiotransferase MtaB [bacterium]